MTAFGRLRAQDGVAYCLGIFDHVAEAMLDTSSQVSLPLFVRLNGTRVVRTGGGGGAVLALVPIAFTLRQMKLRHLGL
jgi:hypothetical protein